MTLRHLILSYLIILLVVLPGCEIATDPTVAPTATQQPTATPIVSPISPLLPDIKPVMAQDVQVSQLDIIRAAVGPDSLGYNELEFLCANEYPEVEKFTSIDPITLTVIAHMSIEYGGSRIAVQQIPSYATPGDDYIGFVPQTEPCTGTYTGMIYGWDNFSDTTAIPPGAVVSEYIRIASILTGSGIIYRDTINGLVPVEQREFGGYLLDGGVQYITDTVPFRTFTWEVEPTHVIYLPLVAK